MPFASRGSGVSNPLSSASGSGSLTRSEALFLSRNWQRWYRDNIPLAEQLYLDCTAENEE